MSSEQSGTPKERSFKLGQKVKLVVTRENDEPAIFEGFVVDEISDMTKNISVRKDKKVLLELNFWLNGGGKRRMDSTVSCHIVDEKELVTKKVIIDGVETEVPHGKTLKNIYAEIKRQYDFYVSRRQTEATSRKDLRVKKQAEKDLLKATHGLGSSGSSRST